MNEALEKVTHDLDFARDGLREAMQSATYVETIILFPLIKRVTEARNDVAELLSARMTDSAGRTR